MFPFPVATFYHWPSESSRESSRGFESDALPVFTWDLSETSREPDRPLRGTEIFQSPIGRKREDDGGAALSGMEQEIVFYLTLCSVRPPAPAKDPDRVCNRSSMRLQPSAPDTWSSLHRIRTSTPSASNDRHSYSGCEKLPPESGSLVRVDGPVGNAKLPGCQGQRPFPSPVGDEDRVPAHEGPSTASMA